MTPTVENKVGTKDCDCRDVLKEFLELYVFNTGLAIARPVFWKPGCMSVVVYGTHFEVCLEPYISLNS